MQTPQPLHFFKSTSGGVSLSLKVIASVGHFELQTLHLPDVEAKIQLSELYFKLAIFMDSFFSTVIGSIEVVGQTRVHAIQSGLHSAKFKFITGGTAIPDLSSRKTPVGQTFTQRLQAMQLS